MKGLIVSKALIFESGTADLIYANGITCLLGRETPCHEDDAGLVLPSQDLAKGLGGKCLPTFLRMRTCFVGLNSQACIQP